MKLSSDELEFLGFDEPEDNTNMADKEEDIRPYTNKGRKRSRNDDDDALEWTLRKCAAASLDGISYSFYDGEMMKVLMPHIERMLSSADWLEREAAVLALGCISGGSSERTTFNTILLINNPLILFFISIIFCSYATGSAFPDSLPDQPDPGSRLPHS